MPETRGRRPGCGRAVLPLLAFLLTASVASGVAAAEDTAAATLDALCPSEPGSWACVVTERAGLPAAVEVFPAGSFELDGSADEPGVTFLRHDPLRAFETANRWFFGSRPRIADGDCHEPRSRFTVHQLLVDVDDRPEVLALDFEERCTLGALRRGRICVRCTRWAPDGESPAGGALAFTVRAETQGPLHAGDRLTYTLGVENPSAEPASGVLVTDLLPSGLTPVAAVATQGRCESAPRVAAPAADEGVDVTCDLGTLDAGGRAEIRLEVVAGRADTLRNRAVLAVDEDRHMPASNRLAVDTEVLPSDRQTRREDVGPGDPAAEDDTAVEPPVVEGPIGPRGTLELYDGFFSDDFEVTVRLTNHGPRDLSDSPGAELLLRLPATLEVSSLRAEHGTAEVREGGQTVGWYGELAAGESAELRVVATLTRLWTGEPVTVQGELFYDLDGDGTKELVALTDDPRAGGEQDPTVWERAGLVELAAWAVAGLALPLLVLGLLGRWFRRGAG